jgi:hypothetical protein
MLPSSFGVLVVGLPGVETGRMLPDARRDRKPRSSAARAAARAPCYNARVSAGADGTADLEAARGRLLALAAAHNKAVLAGVVLSLLAAAGLVAAAVLVAGRLRPLALFPLAAAGWVIVRGVRLERRVVRDLGPGRQAAAALVLALRARGHAAPLPELEAAFSRRDLLRALDFLGRLGLAWAERREAGDFVVLDPARADLFDA